MPAYQQHLVYGTELEDCKTLGDYGVRPGAKVSMAVDDTDWQPFTFQSFVKLPCGKTLTIQLTSDDTIEYIKAWIATESGIPKHEQRLVSGLYQLEEGRRLSDYNIRDTVNMTVLLRLRGGMFGGGDSSSDLSRSFTSDVVAAAPPQVMEDRLSAVEGSIAEIELNYATDNYVDERDGLLHDQIEREAAILSSNIDAVHDRIDTVEASHTMSRDAMAAELDEHSRRIEAIIAGRLLGALAVGGGAEAQPTALAIAAIQTQIVVQQDVNKLKESTRLFNNNICKQANNAAAECYMLRGEVERLTTINRNTQAQLDTLEARINRMTQRAGPYEEATPPPRPRPVLPATFGLRGGMQIFIKTITGKTITIDDIDGRRIILELKIQIRRKLHLPCTRDADFYMIFNGHRLAEHHTLNHNNITSGSTVWMVMRLRGGMQDDT